MLKRENKFCEFEKCFELANKFSFFLCEMLLKENNTTTLASYFLPHPPATAAGSSIMYWWVQTMYVLRWQAVFFS